MAYYHCPRSTSALCSRVMPSMVFLKIDGGVMEGCFRECAACHRNVFRMLRARRLGYLHMLFRRTFID